MDAMEAGGLLLFEVIRRCVLALCPCLPFVIRLTLTLRIPIIIQR